MKNLRQTHLSEADRLKAADLISQLEDLFEGKLAALTEEERVRYGSINEQNKLFVNKVRDYRQNQPNLSSPDVDWDEFENDHGSRGFQESHAGRLESIASRMRSTKILHDHDNYQDALSDYAYSQYKKGAGEEGFTEKVADLKQFFNRTGKTATETPDQP